MNKQTLEKLKNNPHYKLSPAQKKALEELERKPMIEFGAPVKTYGVLPKQTPSIEKHPTDTRVVTHKRR